MPNYKAAFEILKKTFDIDISKSKNGFCYAESCYGNDEITKKQYEILKECLEDCDKDENRA